VLLFCVLTLFTVNGYQREKKLLVEALVQKGETIIRFINSATRESMRANFLGSKASLSWEDHVRAVMEQAVEQPGVDYVTLVDAENRILISAGDAVSLHSHAELTRSFLSSLKDRNSRSFVLRKTNNGKRRGRFFQMAAPFNPFGARAQGRGRGAGFGIKMRMSERFGHHPLAADFSRAVDRLTAMKPLLLVQLRSDQFSSPIRRQIQQMFILLVVFILVAVGSFLSLLTLRGLRGSQVRIGRIEKELQRSERLAALGKMAAGVAHELRNPLSSIKGLALLLKSKIGDESGSEETVDILVGEVERLDRSIGELLDYAKVAQLNRKDIKINSVVEKTVQLINMDIKSQDVSLKLELAEKLPKISADEDKLTQLFLNLLLNGVQAMEGGGIMRVGTSLKNGGIAVTIEDTGRGIEAEDLARVFDPYFTTKSGGTGLGLALSGKIVDEHEGTINLTSAPGKGTRVEVILPGS
jgi:two-component system sensor histidine kinase HydH